MFSGLGIFTPNHYNDRLPKKRACDCQTICKCKTEKSDKISGILNSTFHIADVILK